MKVASQGAGRVYPRVCGGSQNPRMPSIVSPGLSPRVRGKRVTENGQEKRRGSIPACAGEAAAGPAARC